MECIEVANDGWTITNCFVVACHLELFFLAKLQNVTVNNGATGSVSCGAEYGREPPLRECNTWMMVSICVCCAPNALFRFSLAT